MEIPLQMQTAHCSEGFFVVENAGQLWSLFAFIEHFDRILAIILVPVCHFTNVLQP